MSRALSASLEVPASAGTYSAALEGLTGVDEVLMRRDPSIPPLYSSGARWQVKEGDPSELRWRYPADVVGEGWGDCQDLSAYRAAELRVSGEDPGARVRVYPTGENRYHAVVERGTGLIEDPSVVLGMNPIPGAPIMSMQLPAVAGPPISPSGVDPMALQAIRSALRALHPNALPDVSGPPCLGSECGRSPQLARIRDVAPEVRGTTFHVVPHVAGSVCGWKGVHRTPLRDGSAIVGMTRTYPNACDVIGDGPGLMTDIGNAILNHPIISLMLAPEAYVAAKALMTPTSQYALQSTAAAAKTAANNSPPRPSSGGWPGDWS